MNLIDAHTQGGTYAVSHGDGGLLSLTSKLYGVGSGTERLRLAQALNDHPLNRRYLRPPKNAFERKYFSKGVIAMVPRFACNSPPGLGPIGKGRCFPKLYVPPKSRHIHAHLGRLVPTPARNFRVPEVFDAACVSSSPHRHSSLGAVDDRVAQNSLIVPNRFICTLTIVKREDGTGRRFFARGTGVRIGPRHVLTAAHCLLGHSKKIDGPDTSTHLSRAEFVGIAFGRSGLLMPGKNLTNLPAQPFTSQGAYYATKRTQFWMPPEYVKRMESGGSSADVRAVAFDYALVRFSPRDRETAIPRFFDSNRAWHDAVGHTFADDPKFWRSYLIDRPVHSRGYPGDKPCTMWSGGGGPLHSVSAIGRKRYKGTPAHGFFQATSDSVSGMSGSPVWMKWPKPRRRSRVDLPQSRVLFGVLSSSGIDPMRETGFIMGPLLTPFVWKRLREEMSRSL